MCDLIDIVDEVFKDLEHWPFAWRHDPQFQGETVQIGKHKYIKLPPSPPWADFVELIPEGDVNAGTIQILCDADVDIGTDRPESVLVQRITEDMPSSAFFYRTIQPRYMDWLREHDPGHDNILKQYLEDRLLSRSSLIEQDD